MPGRTDSRRRHLTLLVILVVAAASLVSRLTYWQVFQRDRLASQALEQTSVRTEVASHRGTIYDRTGTVVLATSVDRAILAAAPDQLTPEQRRDVADRLVRILGLADDEAAALIARMASQRSYVILARGLEESVTVRVRNGIADGTLVGLTLDSEPVRVYPQPGGGPQTALAAQMLGFVNREGVGQYGVEQYYQDLLGGKPKIVVAQRDVNRRPLADTAQVVQTGVPGADLRLTVDAGLQLAVEQELFAAWVADRAVSVSAIVIDPYSGEVLTEATYPSYDGNDYAAIAKKEPRRFLDPNVSSVYEPGSVFKMLTAVAGFESGAVTPDTKIQDSGSLSLDRGKARVYDADRRPMGWLPFEDIVAYSRNVGAARVALSLGSTTSRAAAVLASTWQKLGFGQPTGIDLAGEVAGLVRDPSISRWREIDLANAAFGQGVAVTPIQLAVAYSAMVNGGTLVQPHVVEAIGNDELSPAARGTVLSADLSAKMVNLMSHVVHTVPWYRDKTLVPGYVVGGKTGTAQIWDPKLNDGLGAWKSTYNYSFVGYIGRDEPEVVVAVTIREAKPIRIAQGNLPLPVESYELFRRIATDAMTLLDLGPRKGGNSTTAAANP